MSQTIYEKNLEALIGIDPLLGSALFSIRENSQFEVFQGKDPIDINIIDIQTHAYLYANPINDLEHHVSSIEERFSPVPSTVHLAEELIAERREMAKKESQA